MEKVGIYGHSEYITAIWYLHMCHVFSGNLIYIFSSVLVYCVEKNLATLAVWLAGEENVLGAED
jgi:hypothetical protein